LPEAPKPPPIPVDVQLAIFTAIQGVHEKLDTISANVRERNDDILALKQRQNRHGRKIDRQDHRIAVLEGRVERHAMRPPGKPEWDPEDTSPHMLAPADLVRLGELAERDRKDSNFWRELPRAAILKGFGMVAALAITAAFTWLLAHH
jgi:hypothetical protein